MASDKAPAYQWYPKDARTDERFVLMSYEQQGIYRALLDHQWLEGSIPSDVSALAGLLKMPRATFAKLWVGIAACFKEHGDIPGRLVNCRLERQRKDQESFALSASKRGAKGAARRWLKHSQSIVQPMANDGSSSPTASPTASPKRTGEPPRPVTARSRRPVFTGQRFVVHEWQLSDLEGLLGPHYEYFDLHAWFFALDDQCLRSGEVPPDRDNGKWLKDRTFAEAQRRGLPLHRPVDRSAALGKQTTRLASALAEIKSEAS